MSIQGIKEKINRILADDTVFYSLVVVLIGVVSFGLGRASVGESVATMKDSAVAEMASADRDVSATAREQTLATPSSTTVYVGSKNSDRYHYPWCPGAQQIAKRNKVTFGSLEEAKAAGYVPAGNCEGL